MNFSAVSRAFAAGVAVVLLALVPGAAVAAEPEPDHVGAEPDVTATADGAFDDRFANALYAPSTVEAQQIAAASRVLAEDLSQRTDSARVFATPDGAWAYEQGVGPSRALVSGDGTHIEDWADIDVTLVEREDSTYGPLVHSIDVAVAGEGETNRVLRAQLYGTDVFVSLLWDGGALPAPVIDGGRATYSEVRPGVDFVLEIRPIGFEQYFVIKTPEAGARDDVYELDMIVEGGYIRPEADGGFTIISDDGVEAAYSPVALAWDKASDDLHAHPVLQDYTADPQLAPGFTVNLPFFGKWEALEDRTRGLREPSDQTLDVTVDVADNPTTATLVLGVDREWLTDETTTYPVIVDPNLSLTFDTYIRSNTGTTAYSTSSELLIGTWDGGTSKYRSYLNFNTTALTTSATGLVVTAAAISLWEHHSYSCSAREWSAYESNPAGSGTVWNNRVAAWEPHTSSTQTRGYSSACGDGSVWIDVMPFVTKWVDMPAATRGILLGASETDSYGWKRFYSSNAGTAGYRPYLLYYYNQYPYAATALTVNAQTIGEDLILEVAEGTPTLRANVSDPDGGAAYALFSIYQDGSLVADKIRGGAADANGISELVMPFDLVYGSVYTVDVWASDGSGANSLTSKNVLASSWKFRTSVAAQAEIPPVCDAFADPTDLCNKLGVSS